jgi:hypothetical protein
MMNGVHLDRVPPLQHGYPVASAQGVIVTSSLLNSTARSPFGVSVEFPLSCIELLNFRDLTPIGVQTDVSEPIAPGTQLSMEVRFEQGPTLAVTASALFCRPMADGGDFWTFVVDWEFVSNLYLDSTLLALLPTVRATANAS